MACNSVAFQKNTFFLCPFSLCVGWEVEPGHGKECIRSLLNGCVHVRVGREEKSPTGLVTESNSILILYSATLCSSVGLGLGASPQVRFIIACPYYIYLAVLCDGFTFSHFSICSKPNPSDFHRKIHINSRGFQALSHSTKNRCEWKNYVTDFTHSLAHGMRAAGMYMLTVKK